MLGLHVLRGLTVQVIRLASRIISEALLFHEFNKFLGRATCGTITHRRNKLLNAEASLLDHIKAPIRTVTIPLSCGIEIHTIIAGQGSKIDILNNEKPTDKNPIILLHGHSLGGATFFRNVDDLISQGYTTIYMPDLPGFGRSSRPRFNNNNNNNNENNAINFFLNPLIELINKLNINQFTLCGHSLGAFLAHEYSLYIKKNNHFNIHINQLILISPAAIIRNTNLLTALWFRLTPQRLLTHGGLLAHLFFNRKYPTTPAYNLNGFRDFALLSNSISTMSGDAAAAAILKVERKGFFNWYSECISPLTERTAKLNCPIHIIGGHFDQLVSIDSLRFLYHNLMVKGNQVAISILANGDHASHILQPTHFANALKRVRVSMSVVSQKLSKHYPNHQLNC